MIYQGVEFVMNPDLPDDQRFRKTSGPAVEVNRQFFGFLQSMMRLEAEVIPMMAKLGALVPGTQEAAEEFGSYAAEVREAIEELKRLPPAGYGVASIGDWSE